MPQYNQTSLASATSQLADDLADPNNIHWSISELQNAIIESLRILQSLTGFYRERESLQTVANQTYYDLRFALDTPVSGTYPYAFTVTDNQLLSEIQAHLLEPVTNPWTGTKQFSIQGISDAMQSVRDQFLSDTGCYVTQTTVPGSGGLLQLPQSLLDIRRAAWQDITSLLTYGLVRTDEYAALGYRPSWVQQPGLPDSYSLAVSPPVSVQLIPEPINAGTLDICILSSGPALTCNPTSPVILGVMDDWCWGIKYGTLAELLTQDGPAYDPDRANYCQQMYDLCVSLAKMPISVLQPRINDAPLQMDAIEDYDRYQVGWQNQTPAEPSTAMSIAPNLIALTPVPDDIYAITLDMARSMIIPSSPSSFLQIDQSTIRPLIDMAQHIVSFKLAGQEFGTTTSLRSNFLRTAALYNARIRANVFYNQLLDQPAAKQSLEVSRLQETANP